MSDHSLFLCSCGTDGYEAGWLPNRYGMLLIHKFNIYAAMAKYQRDVPNGPIWIGYYNYAAVNKWTGWVAQATATPLQEYALPLADGFTQLRDCTYCKTQESMVHIELSVKGNITQGSEVLIATLPEGFRPKRPVRPVAHSHNSPFASGAALIYTDGRIAVIFSSAQTNCNLVCDFLAAN